MLAHPAREPGARLATVRAVACTALFLLVALPSVARTLTSLTVLGPDVINSYTQTQVQYTAQANYDDGSTGPIDVIWNVASPITVAQFLNNAGTLGINGLGTAQFSISPIGGSPPVSASKTVTVVNGDPANGAYSLDCDGVEAALTNGIDVGALRVSPASDFMPLCRGLLVVASQGMNRLQLVDATTTQILKNWQLNTAPQRMLRIPHTPYVFVTLNSSSVARVDLSSDAVDYFPFVSNQVDMVAGEPGEVWLSDTNFNLARFGVNSLASLGTTRPGFSFMSYDAISHSLFAIQSRYAYSPASGQLTLSDSLPGSSGSGKMFLSPDRRHLAVPTGHGAEDVNPAALATVFGTWTLAGTFFPATHADFRFDSKKIAATDGNSIVSVFDVQTHVSEGLWNLNPNTICAELSNVQFVRWSPTGQNFYALLTCNGEGSTIFYGSNPTLPGLFVNVGGTGSGTVAADSGIIQCSPDCVDSYSAGTIVTLTAAPSAGARFARWAGCDSAAGPQCQVTMTGARTVNATFARIVAPMDFDGDVKSDVFFQNADGRAAIWLMNGTAATQTNEVIGAGTGWSVAALGDFNADGKSDLVWQNTDGRMAIYLMNGVFASSTQQLLNAGSGWSVIQTPDLDGDGHSDLLFQNTDGSVAAWLMNGTTMTAGATLIGPGTGWSVIKVADFDGDGNADLLWKHTDGRHAIWLMNGLAVKQQTQILNAGNWTATQVGDFDGDGKADIVWQNTDGTVALWLMNGTAMASGSGILGAGTGWSVAKVGDFDGDGKTDLLFQHTDGRAATYLMNGLTPTSTQQILNAGGGWSAAKILDLNGDGKSDIVWQNTDGTIAVWLMNGTTMSSGSTLIGAGSGWSVPTLGQ